MIRYSFNADLRSVYRRLAAARPVPALAKPAAQPAPHPPLPSVRTPRIELAHVALRPKSREAPAGIT